MDHEVLGLWMCPHLHDKVKLFPKHVALTYTPSGVYEASIVAPVYGFGRCLSLFTFIYYLD